MQPTRSMHPVYRLGRFAPSPVVGAALLAALPAFHATAQHQSLAFTGGVLLNTSVNFRGLGGHTTSSQPGPATGAAVNRTYDNGYNRVDATGNANGTTVNYGYRTTSQVGANGVVLTAASAAGSVSLDDAGAFLEPSANLEYRGSLGSWGESDWGVLLGIGYQSVNQEVSGSFVTDASLIEDRFSLGTVGREDLPAAPYEGTASGTAPRIASEPNRTLRTAPGARLLTGNWEFNSELIPVTGGLYLEFQLAGRLNAIVSAGMLVAFINSDLSYRETSTVGALPSITQKASDNSSDFVFGGFAQLGFDWAIWEDVSLVAGGRWQPSETFSQSVGGRTVEVDFTSAFAVHAGFSIRF